MKLSARQCIAASLLPLTLHGSVHAEAPSPAPVTPAPSIRAAWDLIVKGIQASGAAAVCLKGARVCPIKMRLVEDPQSPDPANKRKICLAEAPDVEVQIQGTPLARVTKVWKLDSQQLDGGAVDFFPGLGILIPDNAGGDHLKDGKAGDPADPNEKVSYHVQVLADVQKTSIYLPAILWKGPRGVELCAAVDPKIVNVN